MKRYFSPQGAKRGLILAAIAVLMWCCWAIGYLSGLSERISPSVVWIQN
jgi:hypothetical protein